MDMLTALAIAAIQGATELFPVSSLGHAVVLPPLLGWGVDQGAPAFLPFLVLLHFGTATALILYFWRDWLSLVLGTVGVGSPHQVSESRRVMVLIIVATIPAVIVGAGLHSILRSLFATPMIAAVFLIANGVLLIAGERLRTTGGHRALSDLRIADALVIGCWQCLALLPGISRSGATIVGGLLRGVDHEGAARFSFLIATPIILAATVLEVPKLLHADIPPETFTIAAIAAVAAAIIAFISTWLLMRWFRSNDSWSLVPFAIYCIVLGSATLLLLNLV